jgi:hypothetical protein
MDAVLGWTVGADRLREDLDFRLEARNAIEIPAALDGGEEIRVQRYTALPAAPPSPADWSLSATGRRLASSALGWSSGQGGTKTILLMPSHQVPVEGGDRLRGRTPGRVDEVDPVGTERSLNHLADLDRRGRGLLRFLGFDVPQVR